MLKDIACVVFRSFLSHYYSALFLVTRASQVEPLKIITHTVFLTRSANAYTAFYRGFCHWLFYSYQRVLWSVARPLPTACSSPIRRQCGALYWRCWQVCDQYATSTAAPFYKAKPPPHVCLLFPLLYITGKVATSRKENYAKDTFKRSKVRNKHGFIV